jgi:FdhD protein
MLHDKTPDRAEAYLLAPDPDDPRLTTSVDGIDHAGQPVSVPVVTERPLTIYLNSQEIVTAMTIGDHPDLLATGFLLNQGMLKPDDHVTGIDFDEDLDVVIVRTARETNYEEKLKKKTRTSGCAVGTVFGDMMEGLEGRSLAQSTVRTSWLYALAHRINRTPSLYLSAGAIHGTVLCQASEPLVYMEDVGRHNAVDKVAGWMFANGVPPEDKILYTTGRLTSEMVLKTAQMGIPTLVSRSGFTAWGVDLARQLDMTLIGRMRGRRFTCLSGADRLVFDAPSDHVQDDPKSAVRKGSRTDD